MNSRQSPFLIPLIIAAAVTVILGITLAVLEFSDGGADTTEPPETLETEPPAEVSIPAVVFKSNLEEYEKYMDVKDEKYLVLVNKVNTVDASFAPEETVKVKDSHKDIYLEKTAAMALEAMFVEMRKNGFSDVFVTSAYRDYEYQERTYNGWVAYETQTISSDARKVLGDSYIYQKYTSVGKTGLDKTDAERVASSYSAKAGTSEHQTGLCVDLMTSSMTALDGSFANQAVYPWLLENAWKFGFVLRFPADKVEETGYSFEPWHYRFVGRYHAYKIYSEGLCLEEYLEGLK